MRDPRREHRLPRDSRRLVRWAAALVAAVTATAVPAQTTTPAPEPARPKAAAPAPTPAATAAGAEAGALTLADALREIAAHSSAAVTAGLNVEAVRELTQRARASYYPSVDLSAGHVNNDHRVVAVFGNLQAPTLQPSFFTGELDVTELLWDGGRRSAAVGATERLQIAVARQGEATVRNVQFQGLQAYLRALSLRAQRRVVEQRATSLKEHLRIAQDLYDHGVVARNDLLQTEVRLRLVNDQAAQVDDAEAIALQGLNRLMGRSPGSPIAVPASLAPPPPMPFALNELTSRTTEANPEILALRAQLKAEEAVLSFQKADDYPTLIAKASHSYQQNEYLLYPNVNSLFVGVSWNAFDGGARKASQREAEISIARTNEQIADIQRRLEVVIDQAYRGYQQALRESATAETNIAASAENLRIEEDQYKGGLARTTEVLDAESVLAESRFALVAQHYNAYLQQGALLLAAGEDLPTFFSAAAPPRQEP
jgi:outer membrane protein